MLVNSLDVNEVVKSLANCLVLLVAGRGRDPGRAREAGASAELTYSRVEKDPQ